MFGLASTMMLASCNGTGGGNNAAGNAAAPATDAAPAAPTAPAETRWVDRVEKTAEGGFRMGNPEAQIKLIEYGSRTCSHCANFATTGMEPLKAYIASGRVSFEFRDFLLNPIDVSAAVVGQCAGAAQFFPILEQMFAEQPRLLANGQQLGQAYIDELEAMAPQPRVAALADRFGYLALVRQRGVPEAQARQCLADESATEALVRVATTGQTQFNVSSTPTFILNGQVIGANTWPQVEAALKDAGA